MSASSAAKLAGLKDLTSVIEMTGQSRQTLQNWQVKKPELFKVVIAGCVALTANNKPKLDFNDE